MRPLAVCCLLLVLFGVRSGHATTFCVTSAAGLQQALDTARNNGVADTIRLAAMTFTSAGAGFAGQLNAGEALTIEGGWFSFSGNCNVRVDDPGLTVIDGGGVRRGLGIDANIGNASLNVRNLTFRNGRTFGTSENGAGLEVSGTQGFVGAVAIERTIFRGNIGEGFGGGLYVSSGTGTLRLVNNLFAANAAAEAAAFLTHSNGVVVHISNNTIVDNVALLTNITSAAMLLSGSSDAVISNNIVWHNTQPGKNQKDLSTGDSVMISNDIETRSGNFAPGSAGNLAVDPQFADADFRLHQDSPLIDLGTNSPQGGAAALDLQGDARIGNGHMDLGAYELPLLFTDGFE